MKNYYTIVSKMMKTAILVSIVCASTNLGSKNSLPDLKGYDNYMAEVFQSNPSLYTKMKKLGKTKLGYSIDDVIRTGVQNPSHPFIKTVGATAGDEESYKKFQAFFYPLIRLRHNGFRPGVDKVVSDISPNKIKNGVLDPKYVLTTRVRAGRNFKDYRLPPSIHNDERTRLEASIKNLLIKLDGEHRGSYKGLYEMTEQEHEGYIAEHISFDKPVSPLLVSAGMARHWPSGRGLFFSKSKNFIVWVNEEDHLRIISMQKGADMKKTFKRWAEGVKKIERYAKKSGLSYQYNDHLGYVHSCPSNIGTGLRAGVFLQVPLLSKHTEWKNILSSLRLQARGTGGVDTKFNSKGIFDISNLDRIGFSETELVQLVIDGVRTLISLEKALENGDDISSKISRIEQKN